MDPLILAAMEARANAYAPYSVYAVGAAVLAADGRIYTGCNVENVSFGLTVCAERTAVLRMVTEGCRQIMAVAVVTRDGGTPCGMCLQTMLEFSPAPGSVRIACVDEARLVTEFTLAELIPHGFKTELRPI